MPLPVHFQSSGVAFWKPWAPTGFISNPCWGPGDVQARLGQPVGAEAGSEKLALPHFRRFWNPSGRKNGSKMNVNLEQIDGTINQEIDVVLDFNLAGFVLF